MPSHPGRWISLGPASELVGVEPDTLRRWADAGRVRSFATPGGHRRFDRADLDRLVRARTVAADRPLSALGAPGRLTRAYARSYRRRPDVSGSPALGHDDRDAFRVEGRQLLAALLAYLDAADGPDRSRWESVATTAVRSTAGRLARNGADLPAAIEAFIAARRPFLEELSSIGRRRSLDVATLSRLYDDAVAVLDRLLVALVEAFHRDAQPNQHGATS